MTPLLQFCGRQRIIQLLEILTATVNIITYAICSDTPLLCPSYTTGNTKLTHFWSFSKINSYVCWRTIDSRFRLGLMSNAWCYHGNSIQSIPMFEISAMHIDCESTLYRFHNVHYVLEFCSNNLSTCNRRMLCMLQNLSYLCSKCDDLRTMRIISGLSWTSMSL